MRKSALHTLDEISTFLMPSRDCRLGSQMWKVWRSVRSRRMMVCHFPIGKLARGRLSIVFLAFPLM